MGRKSSLTPEQWAEIERRHLIDGESVRALAKAFGVDEGTIRKKIVPHKSAHEKSGKPLQALAEEYIEAERKITDISAHISALPVIRQSTYIDLVSKMRNTSGHLASAAEYNAATSHRPAAIAHNKAMEIDDAKPLDEHGLETLKGIAVLTRMSNDASSIGMGLIRVNKDAGGSTLREIDITSEYDLTPEEEYLKLIG